MWNLLEEELSLNIKKSHSEIYEWEQPDELPSMRVINNDAQLKIHQKREIKRFNSEYKDYLYKIYDIFDNCLF